MMFKRILFIIVILSLFANLAAAQTTTAWTGGGLPSSGTSLEMLAAWQDPANWSNGAPNAPGLYDRILFPGGYVNNNYPAGGAALYADALMTGGNFAGNTNFYAGVTFTQTGGLLNGGLEFYVSSMTPGSATMNISGSGEAVFNVLGIGLNAGHTGYMNLSENATVVAAQMDVGLQDGIGYLDVRSRYTNVGTLNIGALAAENNSYGIGTGHATLRPTLMQVSNLNIINGSVELLGGNLTANKAVVGQNGKGSMEVSGGNFTATGSATTTIFTVGQLYYVRGGSAGRIAAFDISFDDTAAAHGIFEQTGGSVNAIFTDFANVVFDGTQMDKEGGLVVGTYNQSGGSLLTHRVGSGVVYCSDNSETTLNTAVTFRAEWNITGNAQIHVSGTRQSDGFLSHGQEDGSVFFSAGKLINLAATFTAGAGPTYESQTTIIGGNIKVDRHWGAYGDNDVLEIKGAKASIEVGRYNVTLTDGDNIQWYTGGSRPNIVGESTLKSNFYLSSEGVSSINAVGFYLGNGNGQQGQWYEGVADLSNTHDIGLYQGFVSLKEDRYDLIVADSFSDNTWKIDTNVFDKTPVGWLAATTGEDIIGQSTEALDGSGRQAAYIYITDQRQADMDNWLWNEESYHLVRDGVTDFGVVNVDGFKGKDIYAHLADLSTSNPLSSDVAKLLVDYLNEVNDGVFFSLVSDTDMLISGSVLNGDGDAYFAWDFKDFNANIAPGANIGIIAFSYNVPEPATWVMLVLGCGAVILFRRRKKA